MNFIRSAVHLLWMTVTVIPWALVVVVASMFISSSRLYWWCAAWLRNAINSGTFILGIQNRITGMENLPLGEKDPVILLVKHQSTWETFLMPAIMPHPLAYVFKKELLSVPFFGWAMGRMDMIHIDRSQRAQAFQKWSRKASDSWTKVFGSLCFQKARAFHEVKKASTKQAVPAWPLNRASPSFPLP